MPSMKDPSPEAIANVTEDNVKTRAQLLPEEVAVEGHPDPEKGGIDPEVQAAVILAESEVHEHGSSCGGRTPTRSATSTTRGR